MIDAGATAILLVEDDAETRHQVAALLQRHGYEVVEAADASRLWLGLRPGHRT